MIIKLPLNGTMKGSFGFVFPKEYKMYFAKDGGIYFKKGRKILKEIEVEKKGELLYIIDEKCGKEKNYIICGCP